MASKPYKKPIIPNTKIMAATISPASTALWGIQGSSVENFQSRSVSTKMDKKEAVNFEGEVIGFAFYGKSAEHSIDLVGTQATTYALGAVGSAPRLRSPPRLLRVEIPPLEEGK